MRFDATRRRQDGREIAVSVTASPVRDATGRVIGIAKVARDITDRREAEAALRVAKDAAEAASRELEAFSYSVAHDLRAPLRGMNGFARILLEDYRDKLDAEGLDCLHEIHTNAQRMGELIDALLSLSRTTRADLRPETIDLSLLVRQIASDLAAAAPERVADVIVQDHMNVCLDPALTRVLFDNLLGNAWKFTANVANAQIEVGVTTSDDGKAVFVRDNGAGKHGQSDPLTLPSVVLLDLKLPRIDGLEVLKRIRESESTRTLPVVILTASKEHEDLARGYALGANAYVRKPVDFAEFAEAAKALGLFWLLVNQAPPSRADLR